MTFKLEEWHALLYVTRSCVAVRHNWCYAFSRCADGTIFTPGLINSIATRGLAKYAMFTYNMLVHSGCRKIQLHFLITVHKKVAAAQPLTQHILCMGHVQHAPSVSCWTAHSSATMFKFFLKKGSSLSLQQSEKILTQLYPTRVYSIYPSTQAPPIALPLLLYFLLMALAEG